MNYVPNVGDTVELVTSEGDRTGRKGDQGIINEIENRSDGTLLRVRLTTGYSSGKMTSRMLRRFKQIIIEWDS